MRNLLAALVCCLVAFTFACSPKQSSSTSSTEASPTAEETPAAKVEGTSGENYKVEVLKADLPSPRKEMTGEVGGVDVVINYGSPSARGRDLWGALVPFGKVWRTGANEATTFEVKTDVMIEGQKLAAGKYALFTKPSKDSWEIIFNSTADQWGAYNHDPSKDVLKVMVSPKEVGEFSETMDFMVEGNAIVFRWGKMAVPFKVTSA